MMRPFATDKLRPKFSFNPRNKDAIIETYLSCLEERLLGIEFPSERYNNLTVEESDALYRDEPTIITKDANKSLVVVVWDRENYFKKADGQLEDNSPKQSKYHS